MHPTALSNIKQGLSQVIRNSNHENPNHGMRRAEGIRADQTRTPEIPRYRVFHVFFYFLLASFNFILFDSYLYIRQNHVKEELAADVGFR